MSALVDRGVLRSQRLRPELPRGHREALPTAHRRRGQTPRRRAFSKASAIASARVGPDDRARHPSAGHGQPILLRQPPSPNFVPTASPVAYFRPALTAQVGNGRRTAGEGVVLRRDLVRLRDRRVAPRDESGHRLVPAPISRRAAKVGTARRPDGLMGSGQRAAPASPCEAGACAASAQGERRTIGEAELVRATRRVE
jgi:hypothetical protein